MTNKLTIVIVTRNRAHELVHCIGSLIAQSAPPDELLIIDNASTDETPHIVQHYSRNTTIPIHYKREQRLGYAIAYNRGLKEAKNSWVGFIDDDCVANSKWVEEMKKTIIRYPNAAAIMGQSYTYDVTNVFCLSKSFLEHVGKINNIKNGHVLDCEILDSKNIVYNRSFLKRKKITFNLSLARWGGGTSEDCDLGMQIQQAGGEAIYCKDASVYHKDITSLFGYYKKLIRLTHDHFIYERQWHEFREISLHGRRFTVQNIFDSFQQFNKYYKLSLPTTLFFPFNIIASVCVIKLLRILNYFK